MKPKPTSAAERAGPRFVIVTLDNHLAGAVDRARRALEIDIPGLDLSFHAAAEWNDPAALQRCLASIAKADIIVATMLFMEEHAQAVHSAIQARRETCDAVLGCMSEPNIVKLTRIGRFNMDGSKRGALDFLKRLRGRQAVRHRRRSSACDAAPHPAYPQIHPWSRSGSPRLFPHPAILARRIGREHRQSCPLSAQSLRRRRQSQLARQA